MTDDAPAVAPTPNSPPVLERMNRLSFPGYVGIGAGIGILGVLLAWAIGPGAHADAKRPGGAAAKTGVEAKAGTDMGAKATEAKAAEAKAAEAKAAEATAAEAKGGGAAEAGSEGADDAAAEGGAAGGTAEGGAADDDAATAAEDGAGATSAADDTAADDTAAAEDEGGSQSSKSKSSSRSAPPTSDPSGESAMTAEELLEAAKKALSEKRYRDAYRLATRSGYKKKSNETYTVKAKAACGMKDEASAKDAFKSLPLGDDRRKKVRDYCKEKGVRLGI